MKDFLKVLIALLVIVLVRGAFGLNYYQDGIDDSNIYFVYVKNFYEGHGFVYNINGARVEGFTSFLWTMILVGIYSLRFLAFEPTVLACCFLITAGLVFLYFRYVKVRYSEPHAWVMVLFVLLTPGFVDWNVFTLMDIGIWMLATSWATLLLLDGENKRMYFLLVFLLPFIRPEGMAFAFVLVFLSTLREYTQGVSLKHAVKSNAVFFLAAALAVGVLTAFRLWYFGYPFPNTFYAKVSMSLFANLKQAFFYLYDAIRHTTFLPFLLLLVCFIHIIFTRSLLKWKDNITAVLLSIVILFFMAYPFLTGGGPF